VLARQRSSQVLTAAKLTLLDLPQDLRVRDNGAIRYVFNYGDATTDISSILGGAPLLLGEALLPLAASPHFRVLRTDAS